MAENRNSSEGGQVKRRSKVGNPGEVKQFIVNPEWENSEEAREKVSRVTKSWAHASRGYNVFSHYYPQDYGLALPEEGGWIRVNKPPSSTEYTVPPFSMWYAMNWQCDIGEIAGVKPKRVKIQTPAGDLGLWPSEYCVVKSITEYVGRESEGIFFRTLGGESAFQTDALFYILSRGIPRQQACMMLLDQMRDMAFGWFEIAPHYGEYYGLEWPEPSHCPFALQRQQWIAEEQEAA